MGQLANARDAFNRALELGSQIDAPLMQSNAHKGLAEVEAARGDYRTAYQHQIEHQDARDRMFNQENAERLQRLQVAHDADRQHRQIELLEQQTARQDAELGRVRSTRTALAVIAALVAISLALLYARFRLKHQSEARLRAQAAELADALDRVRTLKGLLPICAWCKKVRDDGGYWTQVEAYVSQHSEAAFTHSICPSCAEHTLADEHPPAGTVSNA
jgi:hypothetical protein